MKKKLALNVCFVPQSFDEYKSESFITAVIDVLRATSAICTAFHYGANSITPVSTIEEAKKYKSMGYIVGAERHGEKVDGFDMGNSPFSYMDEKIIGKDLILSTTNGTLAINTAKEVTQEIVIASFLNLTAVSNWLFNAKKDIVLLCAGWKNKFNLEDCLLAGAIVSKLLNKNGEYELSDSALAAQFLYTQAQNDLFGFLSNSSHRKRLNRLNLEKDIRYCLTPDQTEVIPVLKNDKLISMPIPEIINTN